MDSARNIFGYCYRNLFDKISGKVNILIVIFLSKIKNRLAYNANHDEIYDADYYEKIEATMSLSAVVIAESILRYFNPKSVVDVGCGTGSLLVQFNNKKINCMGLEYSNIALEMCRDRGLNVKKFDIESGKLINTRADVVISTEVAEHLPADCASNYVDLLVNISDIVIITAATPGQGGTDHVNEQQNEYWIDKFYQRGFNYEKDLTMKLRQEWKDGNTESWYYLNAMVFAKS